MATKKRFDALVKECEALRTAYSEAGVDFMAGLVRFEKNESAWKSGVGGRYGWATFVEVLHVSDLAQPTRFARFKLCVELCGGIDNIRKIGIPAAEKLLIIPPDAPSRSVHGLATRSAMAELIEFRVRNGKEPSSWSAASIVRKHYVPEVRVKPQKENLFDKLSRENRELRAENKTLKARVRSLEKENEKLRERLGGPETAGTARKPQR